MKRSDKKPFDYSFYIERNKQVAMEKYGDKLDKNRNIVGIDYYFDDSWRLCKKGGAEE